MRSQCLWSILAVVLVWSSGHAAARECPPCGPRYCLGDPAFARALAAKKARLRARGIPERLVSLVDRVSPCVGCVEDGPDTVHLQIVYDPTTHIAVEWTAGLERGARAALGAGRIQAFYITYGAKACACCKQPEHYDRRDWDPRLEINTGLAIGYRSPGSLGPEPPDLQRAPPSGSGTDQLPTRPRPQPTRVAQALCPQCRDLAAARNQSARLLDQSRTKLWSAQKQVDRAAAMSRQAHMAYDRLLGEQAERRFRRLGNDAGLRARLDQARDQVRAWARAGRETRARLASARRLVDEDRARLAERDATLRACDQVPCKGKPATDRTQTPGDQAATSTRPPIRAQLGVGPSLGLKWTDHQFALNLQAMVALFLGGRGLLVFSPQFGFGGGSTTVLLPFAFQYDFRLPWLKGLWAYGRFGLGYGGQFFEFGSEHSFLLVPEAGLYYLLGRRFLVGADIFSLPILVGGNGTAVAWRLLFYGGVRF